MRNLFAIINEYFNRKQFLDMYWLCPHITNTFPCPSISSLIRSVPTSMFGRTVCILFCANFRGTVDKFEAPFIDLSSLEGVLGDGSIQYLHDSGFNVLINVVGNSNEDNGIGWSSIPFSKNEKFSQWFLDEILIKYDLNGVEIDDEYYNSTKSSRQLLATVKSLRRKFGKDYIIKKALWSDYDDIPLIKDYIDYGGMMQYYNDVEALKDVYGKYKDAGLTDNQISIGVQPGPPGISYKYTSLETTNAITEWNKHKRGISLYSYSQDIGSFTVMPQKKKPYPSEYDERWLKSILKILV